MCQIITTFDNQERVNAACEEGTRLLNAAYDAREALHAHKDSLDGRAWLDEKMQKLYSTYETARIAYAKHLAESAGETSI